MSFDEFLVLLSLLVALVALTIFVARGRRRRLDGPRPRPPTPLATDRTDEVEPPPVPPPPGGDAPIEQHEPPWLRPTPPLLPRPGPRYPVVLAHGFMGFDAWGRNEYFRGVARRLRRMGIEVHTLRVAPFASVETRARQLASQIDALDCKRVNIVAHSMGGLDARFAIAELSLGKKVCSLTTIGTPHRGTPLANAGSMFMPGHVLRPMMSILGADPDAVRDLTTRRMMQFNRRVIDRKTVDYTSYVASPLDGIRNVNAFLVPSFLVLKRVAGDNDGLVPADSQPWGDVLGEIDADHLAQIGWAPGFDCAGFYESLVRELRGRGH